MKQLLKHLLKLLLLSFICIFVYFNIFVKQSKKQEDSVANGNTSPTYTEHPKNRDELDALIDKAQKIHDGSLDGVDLNYIDTSSITDMSYLFHFKEGNFDISKWDVSKVKNMDEMFYNATSFDKNLDKWKDRLNPKLNTGSMFDDIKGTPPCWYVGGALDKTACHTP